VLLDLLMGVMNSLETWSRAAGERELGIRWRDGVAAEMAASDGYLPYEEIVDRVAAARGLPPTAAGALLEEWERMEPWPDATALAALPVPYAFVTNCSERLGSIAARRSGLTPRFTLTAERAGRYKPSGEVYVAALQTLGISAAEALYVAGSPYDADGAHRAGVRTWLVVRRPDQRAPDPAVRLVSSLEEILIASSG
jgi:2-haloalkanoic acid dehalogenase type II